MSAADTAKLIAALSLKDAFSGPLKKADSTLSKFDSHLDSTQGRAYKAGQQIGTGIKRGAEIAAVGVGLLATQVFAGLNQLSELEGVTTQTNAALLSTKSAAGLTAEAVRALAEKYEGLNATIDDKVIQSGENVLLTFTNVRKEAFEPALAAALDLSVAMGQDLQQSVVQIGKALNDPAKGFTALRRAGIQFTASQEKQIKTLQKSGDLLGAQQIILKELGTEFGGRFAAQGKTATGTIAGIGDAIEDLQKATAQSLFPTIQKLLPKFREFLTSPAFIKGAEDIGKAIGDIFSEDNIAKGADALQGLFKIAQQAAPVIQSAASVTGEVIKTAVGLFRSLPPEIQALAVAGLAINKLTGGLVTNIAGGLIQAVLGAFKGAMNVTAGVVNVNGLAGAAAGGAGRAAGALGTAARLIQGVFIVGIAAEAADLIHGVISPGGGLQGRTETKKLLPADQLEWPFGPKNTPDLNLGPLEHILGGDSGFAKLDAAAAASAAALKQLQQPQPAQDADEKRVMANRDAFTSTPTRRELRVQIGQLKEAQKKATSKNADDIRRKLHTVQGRLDTRIANAAKKAAEDSATARRAIVAAIEAAARAATPVINIPVTTQTIVNGRILDANINRYSSTFVNGQRPRVGGA